MNQIRVATFDGPGARPTIQLVDQPKVPANAALFEVGDERLSEVLRATAGGEKHILVWPVEVLDEGGDLVARVTKTLYVRKKPG